MVSQGALPCVARPEHSGVCCVDIPTDGNLNFLHNPTLEVVLGMCGRPAADILDGVTCIDASAQ